MPIRSSRGDRLRADPRHQAGGVGGEALERFGSRERTTRPAGLPSSLVIFASIRFSEIPIEQVSRVSSRISVAIRRIVAFGEKRPVRST